MIFFRLLYPLLLDPNQQERWWSLNVSFKESCFHVGWHESVGLVAFLLNICILEYCYTLKLFATQVMTFGGRIVECVGEN